MLQYAFMQRAFLVSIVVGIIFPCIGIVLMQRKHSMLGDALSHSALAGVCMGLLFGWSPTVGSIIACIIACFAVSGIGKKFPYHKEIAIAVILSLGIGLSSVLADFVKTGVNFNSYLFGSIVAISIEEFYLIIALGIVLMLLYRKYYYAFMFYAYDEKEALRNGISIRHVEVIYTFMIGIAISISARIVGALIVSSLLVIPCACGVMTGKSYRSAFMHSILYSLCFMISGLCVSYYFDLRPGGTIVLISCFIFGLLCLRKR